jgi:NAD(P)-dependent dehydrogenase (short-subunit alcohol dehydrogenase family)
MRTFEGKVGLVTGASAGIGRATAVLFAGRGARLVLGDVDPAGGQETERLVKEAGGEALFLRTDVTAGQDVADLVNAALDSFGRLDFAYNNAGVEGTQAPLAEAEERDWERTLDINLKGVWLCMHHEIPAMLRNGGGAIVNTASVAGLVGFPNLAPYVASKHGVIGLTRTAALEYATSGIRVNAVCPGVIRTAMVERVIGGDPEVEAQYLAKEPVGRMGTPEEVGEAVVWLCSDAASFVTGHALAVDGGLTAQ